jgi:hypothetical protein
MNRERSIWGVILIVIGVIFLGERLGWAIGWSMGRLWPLILIAIGAVQLASRRSGAGVWLLFIGGLFLLHQNHILRMHDAWPLFIVAAGVAMLFGRSRRTRFEPTAGPDQSPVDSGGIRE